jgi:hypothetical protein
MLMDKPIVVSAKPLQLSGTVRGPIVVTPQEGDSGDTTPRLGYNQPTYKVKLVANGKTFNMLLPPSIESKHPGRSNPLQLPGLQIKANINISKLKIPGFFPIYQNLGVESLTISMSGMFTGYDGANLLSAANWENSVGIGQSNVEQGQDSFTSASELYDFAVNNKALVQVTIYTSDGSFIPKQSTSTAFRDNNSNISFKGYIKEFEQVYIRQDRNYYLLRFEIVDFGSNKCKTVVKSDKKKTTKTGTTSINSSDVINADDRKYRSKEVIEQAEKIKALIDKNADIKEIEKELESLGTYSLKYKLLLYAESKNYKVDNALKSLLVKYETADTKPYPISFSKDVYTRKEYIETAKSLCSRFNDPCVNTKKVIEASEKDILNYTNSNNTTSTTTNTSTTTSATKTVIQPNSIADKQDIVKNRYAGTILQDTIKQAVEAPDFDFASTSVVKSGGRSFLNRSVREDTSLFDARTDTYQWVGADKDGDPIYRVYKNGVRYDSNNNPIFLDVDPQSLAGANKKYIVLKPKDSNIIDQAFGVDYEIKGITFAF